MALGEKSHTILQALAKGHAYEQILVQYLAYRTGEAAVLFPAIGAGLRLRQTAGGGKCWKTGCKPQSLIEMG
ncbi:MAG: hypothetical protein HZA89_00340 [Verrucomicrobia bacterium]|nr:hypothetical protein [Verrucomicrobiota bacterium]